MGKVKGQMNDRFPFLSELLIKKGVELIIKSFSWAKGKVSRKLSDFIQACAAYIYIGLADLPLGKLINIGQNVSQVV